MPQSKEIFKHPLLITAITGLAAVLTTGTTMIYNLNSDVNVLKNQVTVIPALQLKISTIDQVDVRVEALEDNIRDMNQEIKSVVRAQAEVQADVRSVIQNQEMQLDMLRAMMEGK